MEESSEITRLLSIIKPLFNTSVTNPKLFIDLWNSLTEKEKMILTLESDLTGLNLLHLITYYTPKNQDISEIYLDNYFPILKWICEKTTNQSIFNSKCKLELIDSTTKTPDKMVSPIIISSYRYHLIYLTQMIIYGANPYEMDDDKSTLIIVKNSDDYKIKHLTEVFSVFCLNHQKDLIPSKKYVEINKIHEIFYNRRAKIIESIYNGIKLIESGLGHNYYCIQIESNYNLSITPILFIKKVIPILEQYLKEWSIYIRIFGPDYSLYQMKSEQIDEIIKAVKIAKSILI